MEIIIPALPSPFFSNYLSLEKCGFPRRNVKNEEEKKTNKKNEIQREIILYSHILALHALFSSSI